MMDNIGVLPRTWCNAKISEITSVNPTIDKAGIPDDLDISFVPMPAVQAESGIIDVSGKRKFLEVKKGYTPFLEGDVLFAKITPCMENGKMAVVPEVRNGIGFGSTEFHVLRAFSGVIAKYVYYYVSSQAFRREAEHNMSGAVGQRRVTTPFLSACEVPLPPTNEQHRIVAKIEELFSELDKGIENLKTAQAQLKVYRQALLKHAFEGKLTAQWRAERYVTPAKAGVQPLNDMDSRLRGNDSMGGGNDRRVETAEALLKRIQQERAQRFQQQLAAWEAVGKQGSKPKTPKTLEPLTAEELAELPELPEGWGWTRLASIVTVISGYAFKSGDFVSAGVPVVKIANVGYSEFVDKDQEYLDSFFLQTHKDFLVSPDDFLLALTRPITNNRTKVCRYPKDAPLALLNQRVSAMKKAEVNPEFLYSYFGTSLFKESIRSKFSETLQPNLSPKDLEACPIPICALTEQEQIFCEIESRLSEVDQLDQTITTSLQQAEALRQSILKKAFSGQLVEQDPHDEPASALLARIKAERAVGAKNAHTAAKPRKTAGRK
ncbi:MAG: restriction endonuclease subunit S [Proteobacteria bacterium]|nr:restriction endonuclease subunit S [Pseudomonadota bacterium]